MKIYRPNDKLNFGKYKGEDVRFIYTFDPEYIQWLIIYNDHFAIDIDDFKDRHTFPMDVSGITNGERGGFIAVTVKGEAMKELTFRAYLMELFSGEYEHHYLSTPAKINKFTFSKNALFYLKKKTNK